MSTAGALSEDPLGTRKSRFTRSRTTNDPLALPPGLRGTTAEGRRWSDLVAAYQEQLGERMQREDVRALVGSLVSLTLVAERLNAQVARGDPVDPHHIIGITQTIQRLLADLGLSRSEEHLAPRGTRQRHHQDVARYQEQHPDGDPVIRLALEEATRG